MPEDPEAARIAELVEVVARLRGHHFSAQRLAAVVPEVRRLRDLIERLRALPIDDEFPAGRFSLP